ncbi:uncharacterized protein LY89DRAFT_725363 [Mollisia scopiformis]|uniref:CMP/dCMP-type deaminase domain-containing protein n=1 Tax=Mollisia scopiformis TaxID=149040 RepID=A0A132B8N0_MOLSC|nr:uncharacterized protein LY89DRAFT_725363 [Mollisia scopiformis]KUJ08027.1 hypothetical protein LY89DRAFT_725363 [Mollisia scopiformis]
MSPRNDTYLSLALAQANLSPLHYRHGAIIVRGGKVIGQGFNCYKPGFDGGALKTGSLPSSSIDGPAIAELKERLKTKTKPKSKSKQDNQQDEGTFTPFESMGCGHNANAPLSMHSEMMAIKSALSLSSGTLSSQTSARSAKCFEKPCFKLPGDSKKRKARARALKAYAAAVCLEASTGQAYGGKFSIQKQSFEPGTSQPGQQGEQQVQRQGGEQWVSRSEGGRGGESERKCRETPQEEKPAGYYPHGPQHKHYQHKRGSEPHAYRSSDNSGSLATCLSSPTDDFIKSKTPKNKNPTFPPSVTPKPQQILITKNKSLNAKHSVAARTKDLRLKGSDLYVARLGTHNTAPLKPKSQHRKPPDQAPPSPPTLSKGPSSLYDELSPLCRSVSPSTSLPDPPDPEKPEIRASRPCYRCVAAMHSVGIKRVFWTTQDGEWEGAKVRDLVEALEMGLEGDGEVGTGQESKGVFVTKHEVLMLKRVMGL